ncbi:MAG: putative baseplate assembly protein, partial [Dehalococcoidia bacterium]|nr:putative baseplate assembly protein [Dehalococcoidia bacterium]
MTLPSPNLDDRKFQDLVDECKRMIPRYCPEWTDHNVSDPGVTLIELFAWMVDILLYRLNRVPEKNYIKFLELIGLSLQPPQPARADITVRLASALTESIQIPKGTEVATMQTETHAAITFTTNRDLTIRVPHMLRALVTRDEATFYDYEPLTNPASDLGIFGIETDPQGQAVGAKPNSGLYLGYTEDLAGHVVALDLKVRRAEAFGIDPRNPPFVWEYWDGFEGRWEPLGRDTGALESDATDGIEHDGAVILHLPFTAAPREIGGREAFWIRCRATELQPGQRPYRASPRIRGIETRSIGGTVPAHHAVRVQNETLGVSDGTSGQVFKLQYFPVLPREAGETIEVRQEDGIFVSWQEVESFGSSDHGELCYTLDSVSGEVRFGPTMRQPDGRERAYGQVPPLGSAIRFTAYRVGGGLVGNVGKGAIRVLKSSIPFVDSVTNRRAAVGGTEPESLEHAAMRAPQLLHARTRAVTEEDFEYLARQASPAVARARCFAGERAGAQPGTIRLLIVPAVGLVDGPIYPSQLVLSPRLRQEVQSYLDERRLLTTILTIAEPRYLWVSVETHIRARARADVNKVRAEAERRLYRYVNPISGGPDEDGWPLGRELFVSELYSLLQGIPGVQYVQDLSIYPIDPTTRARGVAITQVTPQPDG